MSQNIITKPAVAELMFSLNTPDLEFFTGTYVLYTGNKNLAQEVCQKANTTLSLSIIVYMQEGNLKKHPSFVSGSAEFPSGNLGA